MNVEQVFAAIQRFIDIAKIAAAVMVLALLVVVFTLICYGGIRGGWR